MRSSTKLALIAVASIVVAVAGFFGVIGGAKREWQVPIYAAGLIAGSVFTGICMIVLAFRAFRWALGRVR